METAAAPRAPRMRPRLPMAVALCVVVAASLYAASAAAECVASYREIGYADGSARIKNYVCRTGASAEPTVRVEFNRLSEAAAGALLQGELFPEMKRSFGKLSVLDNPVGAEAKLLFDSFGIRQASSDCFGFAVYSAGDGRSYENDAEENCSESSLWSFAYPDRVFGAQGYEMPLPDDDTVYRRSTSWPAGFQFYYNGYEGRCTGSLIECTTIWRGAQPSDLANYTENLVRFSAMVGYPRTREEIEAALRDPASWDYRRGRYFGLVEHLTREGWPEDFLLVVSEELMGCAADGGYYLHVRQLILDVAMIENISGAPVAIDSLIGTLEASNRLRPSSAAPEAGNGDIALPAIVLQPGETVVVPLMMSFLMSETVDSRLGPQGTADAIYAEIQALPRGSLVTVPYTDPPVSKTRESFGPPVHPSPTTYIYGPAMALSGLTIDGEPIVFEEASRNFLKLAAGWGYGSCPYLYAWRNEEQGWIRYGKVIESADEEAKTMTERVTFDGFPLRFRLAEEEMEVAFIDHVTLEVELNDGGGFTLRSSEPSLQGLDSESAIIPAGGILDFAFDLPAGVTPETVKSSTLAVTGYYRRYASLRQQLAER